MSKKTYTWIFRIVLIALALYVFIGHLEIKASSNNPSKKIKYTFISKEINGGRGHRSDVYVRYKDSVYHVGLHHKNYDRIGRGILPDLYYSATKDYVFDKDAETRLTLVFLILVIVVMTFLPLEEWERRIRG